MPYTLPAALTTAMDSGIYEPYLRAVLNSAASDTDATTVQPLSFKKEALTAQLKIAKFSDQIEDYAFFRLVRGAVVSGTPSTISSVWFKSIEIIFDGRFVSLKGEVFDRSYQVVTANSTYKEVIEFVGGQAAEYVASSQITYEGAAAWKNYQFYPTGKTVVVSPAKKLFTLLQQKYLVFATENLWDGAADNLFFFVATDTRATDYTFTDLLFEGNEHNETRRLISRDEANTVHSNGSATAAIHNLGFLLSTASQPTNTANPYVGARSSKIPVHLKYRTGDKAICNGDGSNMNAFNSRINVIEIFDPKSTPAWYQIIEALVWYGATEGGPMPSTIEAAAPYTPLATGNFDGVLTSNDNNLQAAMETIDDHEHTTSTDLNVTETLQLSGDITPSALTANQNNYNPTGWSAAVVMRLQTDGTNRTITGLAGGTDGRIAILINIDSANIISLQDESGSSTAANRFYLPTSTTLLNIHPDASVVLQYDSTSSRWRVLSLMDHALLTGIGSNTHSQIDTHISSTHLAFNDGEGNPADPGSAAADGTSAYAARRDHVHKGPTKAVIIFPTHALSDTVNASSTEYLCPFIDGNFGTERAMAITRAGTVKNFYVRQVGTQPASGTLVCHVRQNTASDIISITIAAGSAGPATRSETATSVAVSAGDFIGFKFVNNATAVSATIGFVIVEIEFDP